jgi:hypothetical protein
VFMQNPCLTTFHQPFSIRAGPGALPFAKTSAERLWCGVVQRWMALVNKGEIATFPYLVATPPGLMFSF